MHETMSQPGWRGPQPWEMPSVEIGDIVHVLKSKGDVRPTPAIVNSVGPRTVHVNTFVDGQRTTNPMELRHRDDPDLGREYVDPVHACWVHSSDRQWRTDVERAFFLLEKRLAHIEGSAQGIEDAARRLEVHHGAIQGLIVRLERIEKSLDITPADKPAEVSA